MDTSISVKQPFEDIAILAVNQEDAARLCGISVSTLWRDTRLGKVRRTSRGVYPLVELKRYLQADLVDDEFGAKKLKQLGRTAKAASFAISNDGSVPTSTSQKAHQNS